MQMTMKDFEGLKIVEEKSEANDYSTFRYAKPSPDYILDWPGHGKYYAFQGRGTPSGGFRISADRRKAIYAGYSQFTGINFDKDGNIVSIVDDIGDTFSFRSFCDWIGV